MKTKIFFLVMILNIIITMSLSAQVVHINLSEIKNHTKFYYCTDDVDSVVIHASQGTVGGEFFLSEINSVVFAESITINQQNQGSVSWVNVMLPSKQIYIYFISSEEYEKLK